MIYRHYGSDHFDPQKFEKVQNQKGFWVKPKGGLWASPLREDGTTGWERWCRSEGFHLDALEEFFDFHLDCEMSRILRIDTLWDLESLLRRCGREPELSVLREPGRFYPDFEKMMKYWDAVYLTDGGQWRTRLTQPNNLYGWDCECILVMNKKVIRLEDKNEDIHHRSRASRRKALGRRDKERKKNG